MEWKWLKRGVVIAISYSVSIVLLVTGVLAARTVRAQDSGNVFKPAPLTPGPWVKMTHGSIWPRPKQQNSWPYYLVVDREHFNFQVELFFPLKKVAKALTLHNTLHNIILAPGRGEKL